MDFDIRGQGSGYTSDLEEALQRQGGGGEGPRKSSVLPPPRPPVDVDQIVSKERRRLSHSNVGLDAYSMHKKFINDYVLFYGKELPRVQPVQSKTESDILHENYRFVRQPEDDQSSTSTEKWEKQLARAYYEKLFKEYCVADFSRYKEFKIGMRWRTEQEVKIGKGQFICGGKGCETKEGLNSYEVNFKYKEDDQIKNALVKLRACPQCAHKLNYKKHKEEKKAQRKRKREQKKEEKRRKKLAKREGVSDVAEQRGIEEVTIKREPQCEEDEEWEEKTTIGEGGETGKAEEAKAAATRLLESDIWRKPLSAMIESKSKGDEYDDYFQGLFP